MRSGCNVRTRLQPRPTAFTRALSALHPPTSSAVNVLYVQCSCPFPLAPLVPTAGSECPAQGLCRVRRAYRSGQLWAALAKGCVSVGGPTDSCVGRAWA